MQINLMGPFALDTATLNNTVLSRTIGAYVLGYETAPGKMEVHYVGRSASGLIDRLKDHVVAGRYAVFGFQQCLTEYECYGLECALYHQFGADALDNEIHPAGPSFLDTCAFCGR